MKEVGEGKVGDCKMRGEEKRSRRKSRGGRESRRKMGGEEKRCRRGEV